MIPIIDFDDLVTTAEWHGALDTILDATQKHISADGIGLQRLLLEYSAKCPFQQFCELAQKANLAIGASLISSAIDDILSRNADISAATDEIGDVTETATKQASGLLMQGPLDALGKVKLALDALKPSGVKGAGE